MIFLLAYIATIFAAKQFAADATGGSVGVRLGRRHVYQVRARREFAQGGAMAETDAGTTTAHGVDGMTTDREEPITSVGEHADSWRSQAADGLLPVNVVSRDSHHKIGHLGPSKQDWRTPRALWNQLNAEFRFTLDAAADEDNTLCRLYYDQEQNALTKQWWTDSERGAIFVNPPYARLYPWVQKAYEESRKGATVVMLLPASTDTKWFHEIVQPYAEVRFIRGRLKFEGAKHPATFASMIVIFRPWKVTAGGAE